MTRILVDARIGWASGIGRYSANAVPRVARAMPDTEFDLLVTPIDAQRASQAAKSVPNLRVRELDLPAFAAAEQWQLPQLARGYDLTWFVNYWVPLAVRGRFIAVVHDMLHLEPSLFPASRLKRALARRTFHHLRQHAAAISFDSRFSQREFERMIGKPRNSKVCGIGIDHDGWQTFDPDDPPAKERLLLLVAATKAHKNFRMAIDAFAQAELPPSWQLVIVSPDSKLRSSIDLDALITPGAQIEVHSGLSNTELRSLYARAAIVLMPSRYEGFGLPLLEGLQSGAQVISSTAASLVEVGQGAQIAFVHPDDEQGWIKAIENESRRFDQGLVSTSERSENMRHALSYDWDSVARATIGLIEASLTAPQEEQSK